MCFVLGCSIIFGNTLSVSASEPITSLVGSSLSTGTLNSVSFTVSYNPEQNLAMYNWVNGNTNNSTGQQYIVNESSSGHMKVPFYAVLDIDSANSLDIASTYGFLLLLPNNIVATGGNGVPTISNICITDGSNLIATRDTSNFQFFFKKGAELKNGNDSSSNRYGHNFYLEFDYSFSNTSRDSVTNSSMWNSQGGYGTFRLDYFFWVYELVPGAESVVGGQQVIDTATVNKLSQLNNTQQQGNTIAQENVDTNKDTNNKITNFFNSFFDNLVHIFVPEDGFFSDWFNELNDFFASKLGFLYAPFDFIISFFNGVLNTIGTQDHGFTIPALSWEGTEFCPEVNFSFDMFAEEFPQLQEAVYFFSDVVIILALMRGIRAKLDLVMGVHEE